MAAQVSSRKSQGSRRFAFGSASHRLVITESPLSRVWDGGFFCAPVRSLRHHLAVCWEKVFQIGNSAKPNSAGLTQSADHVYAGRQELVVRNVALLQIFLLLGTTLVPATRVRLVSGSCCGDDCQCSAADRAAGACCCTADSAKTARLSRACCQQTAKEQTDKEQTDKRPSDAATASPVSRASATCPACKKAAESSSGSCCNKVNSVADAGQTLPAGEIPPWGAVERCPCGETVTHVAVHMPRVRPLRVQVSSMLAMTQRISLLSEHCSAEPPEPPLRPPRQLGGSKIA